MPTLKRFLYYFTSFCFLFTGTVVPALITEDAEKATLLKEIRELKRANEILKEALGFFAVSQKK